MSPIEIRQEFEVARGEGGNRVPSGSRLILTEWMSSAKPQTTEQIQVLPSLPLPRCPLSMIVHLCSRLSGFTAKTHACFCGIVYSMSSLMLNV